MKLHKFRSANVGPKRVKSMREAALFFVTLSDPGVDGLRVRTPAYEQAEVQVRLGKTEIVRRVHMPSVRQVQRLPDFQRCACMGNYM
jgi:hypothetical protein